MKSRHVLSTIALLLLAGPGFALCKLGSTATCSVVQVALSTPLFTRFANTFLRKIWHYDFQNANGVRNMLSANVDGTGYIGLDMPPISSPNWECAGWIPLTQFEHWMWIRCRDSTFHDPGFLRVDNWAALLRYRQYLYSAPP